jgi:subtilisin family serine protease
VVNCSFGGSTQDFGYTIDTVYDRGTTVNQADLSTPPGQYGLQATYNGNWDIDTLSNLRVRLYYPYIANYGVALAFSQSYDAALATDVLDAANEGIITVGAAGNSYGLPNYVLEHPEYNNYYETLYNFLGIITYHNFFHHNANRGPWPAASQRGTSSTATNYEATLCVGNLGSLIDERASFSSCVGDRVDVFAPGTDIMSSWVTSSQPPWHAQEGVADSRNSGFYLTKLTGTSMASPQVAGVVATIIGDQPWLSMKQMRQHIVANADSNHMWVPTSPAFNDDYQLRGAANKILNYSTSPFSGSTSTNTSTNTSTTSTSTGTDIRPIVGNVFPPLTHGPRPTHGQAYPRSRIRRG